MREEVERNEEAARRRSEKLTKWPAEVERFERYFKAVCSRAEKERYFETLYVHRTDEKRHIQLFAGQHPIDVDNLVDDGSGRPVGRKLIVERGAGLVITQSVSGDVFVFLFPYASERAERNVKHIVWRVFDSPERITRRVLGAVVRDFFTYVRVTSVLFSPAWTERMRILCLELKSKKYTAPGPVAKWVFGHWFWIALGAVGSIASIYSIL